MQENIGKWRYKKYKRLENEVKEYFKDDKTLLKNFYGRNRKLDEFFNKREIFSLGDYMVFALKKSNHAILSHFCNRHDIDKEYKEFTDNILDYVNKKLANSIIFNDEIHNNSSLVMTEEHYKHLQSLPEDNFVKGSKAMEKISKQQEDYLKKLTSPYVEQEKPFEEIEEIIDTELGKFHKIVDEKRAGAELSSKVNNKIQAGVKYKYGNFSHQEGHKHFDNEL